MAQELLIKVRSAPGIKRDGTRLDSPNYLDGNWCRFQRGLPRKMGGYRSVSQNLPELVYGMSSFSAGGQQYLHLGSESQLNQKVVNSMGAVTAENDRTPAGLVPSSDNIWTFDAIFNLGAVNDTVLVAHAAPNMDISAQDDRDIFYGVVTDSGILLTSAQDPVSGGVIVVGNYVVGYGNGGYVQWSAANDVTAATLASANVTQQKIVAARRIRGGGVPAAVLWSLDSLLLMSFVPNALAPEDLWDFDTLTDDSSILSSRCVVEYDGEMYWPGVDRFLVYNGVVREVPNDMNSNYFFDNLNQQQRQKIFGYKVPRFGEIWWCYPRGSATECTHAIVYNVREKTWYDTPLVDEGRTDGIYAKVYFKPFMMGAEATSDGYDLWQHETGVNRVRLGSTSPIPSHFETAEVSMVAADADAVDKALSVGIVEPDFVQAGELTLTISGRQNARTDEEDSDPVSIPEAAADADDQVARFKTERRLLSFRFDSNVEDGDYQLGKTIAHVRPTDGRVTQ